MSVIGGIAAEANKYSSFAGQLSDNVIGNGFNITGVGSLVASNLTGLLTTPVQNLITGLGIQTQTLNMGGNAIIGASTISSGISPLSADLNFNRFNLTNATSITGDNLFGTVQTASQPGIKTIGDYIGNLNMNSNRVINVAAPVSANDATNKTYVDNLGLNVNASNLLGDRLASNVVNSNLQNLGVQNQTLNMGSNNISNCSTILANNLICPEISGTNISASRLTCPEISGTSSLAFNSDGDISFDPGVGSVLRFTRNLDMNISNSITRASSVACSDILMNNLGISNTGSNGNIRLTPSGTGEVDVFKNLHMNLHRIRGVGAPTQNNDAATKTYVDSSKPTAETLSGTALNPNITGSSLQSLGAQTANLDMNTRSIDNANFVTAMGLRTTYLSSNPPDTLITALVPLSMNNAHKITGLVAPTDANDAATKAYVDSRVFPTAETLSGSALNDNITGSNLTTLGTQSRLLNMGNFQIINLATPLNPSDAANKTYVDDLWSETALPSSFTSSSLQSLGVQNLDLNMGTKKIINLNTPVLGTDAVTKNYVDTKSIGDFPGTALSTNVVSSSLKSLGVQTANLNMGNFKITNLAAPTSGTDAATKTYVDSIAPSVSAANLTGDTLASNVTISSLATISPTNNTLYVGSSFTKFYNFGSGYVALDGSASVNTRSIVFQNAGQVRYELGMKMVNGSPGGTSFFIWDNMSEINYLILQGNSAEALRFPRYTTNGFMSTKDSQGVLWINPSDRRVKHNEVILDTAKSLETIMKLKPKSFDWKEANEGRHDVGFVAQDVEEFIPEAVDGKKFEYEFIREGAGPGVVGDIKKDENGNPLLDYDKPRYRTLNTTAILSVLVSACQEMEKRNRLLEQKVVELEEIVSEFISEFSPNKRAKLE